MENSTKIINFCHPQSYGLRVTYKLIICMCVFSDHSVIGRYHRYWLLIGQYSILLALARRQYSILLALVRRQLAFFWHWPGVSIAYFWNQPDVSIAFFWHEHSVFTLGGVGYKFGLSLG